MGPSHQKGWPTWKNKTKVNVTQRNNIWSPAPKGGDTKTNWPTDRWSQYNLNLNYSWVTLFLGDINTGTWPSKLGSLKWDSKIWSWVLLDFDPRVTALARPRSNCTSKLQTHPLIREGAPHQESRNRQTEKKNLIRVPLKQVLDRGPVEAVTGKSSEESVSGHSAKELVIGPSSSECTMSQELLWLCDVDSSGTQEGEHSPQEAGTRGLEGQDSRQRGLSACIVNYRL
jgi:hypothetical protein